MALAILTYLRRHPDAKDNLEGIAMWWANEERDLVDQSLCLLIDLGTVRKEHELYSLSDSTRNESSEPALERLMVELRQKMQK